MTDVIDLRHVTVRRGATTILDKLDWQVFDTERWIILGANGAGKTTLLQIVAARMFPSEGTVTLLGEQMGRVDVFELRPRIGLSSAALAERIPRAESVLNTVLTAAYGMTGRWREQYDDFDVERARALLNVFGVGHLEHRTFGSCSEGERKRVQIARALMADPEILLLDEPAAGLDLAGREELVGALTELAGDKRSPVLILVTHHVEEIPPGFTHLMLLAGGKVYAAGPIDEVLNDANLTRAFGLPLQVTKSDGRWSARAKSGKASTAGGRYAGGDEKG